MLRGGEVDAIWWDRLGLMLDEDECGAALKVVRYLQEYPDRELMINPEREVQR